MRFVLPILLLISVTAQAQFGVGLAPGSSCNGQNFGPASQATNGNDELLNLSGQLAARNNKIDQLRAKEDRVNEHLVQAKRDIAQVITPAGFAAIREHRERGNHYESYRTECGGGGSSASRGEETDPELFSGGGGGRVREVAETQYPPPDCYCVTNPANGRLENIWEKFVEDDGTVSDRLCDFKISRVTRPASRDQRERCHEGLHEYYDRMEEKEKLADQIAKLDHEARAIERRLGRVRDEITDGTYCPWCNSQRRGYSNQGTGNSMSQGFGILAQLGLSLLGGGQQNRRPTYPQPVVAPAVLPYGGQGYLQRPYAAPVPGYYGVQQGPHPGLGQYGAIPGGIGPGAFGCQGGNPAAFGNPYGSPGVQPIFGGQSPFNNPYANPAMASPFNQGGGPGWGVPQYANGQPGYQDPFGNGGGTDVWGNPINQNLYGNRFSPNPFGQNPFGGPNPYAPNVLPYAQNPFGQPYGAGGSPYGGSPYSSSPFGGAPYAGAPFVAPYAGQPYPFGGAPNSGYQNYLGEINRLNGGVQYIQNGSYFGGGNYAPSILPYAGAAQPSFPRANPPAILPYTR